MLKKILLIIAGLSLAACSDGYMELLNRNDILPIVSSPMAESFLEERTIKLSWEKDPGAEDYVLYRDLSPSGDFSSVIYRGEEVSFSDENLVSEGRYYYKLAKVKGKYEYNKSEYAFGVGASVQMDSHEPNDQRIQATPLSQSNLTANIFYYKDDASSSILDRDWYSFKVYPNTIAKFMVEMVDSANGVDMLEMGINYEIPAPLSTGEITLVNSSDLVEEFTICIQPNKPLFTNSAGGQVVGYQIVFNTIVSN